MNPGPVVSKDPEKMTPQELEKDVLIVTSKLKQYIRAKSGMNTSADVVDVLSQMVRRLCDTAIDHARTDGRRTVMERDFQSH